MQGEKKVFILDAMSSFAGVPIDVESLDIDFLISSANKCIQGVPGFSFIIAKTESLMKTEGKSNSLSLDLFDQWKEMNKDGKWRYTSPTHVVAAFSKAIDELMEEGGIKARYARYKENNRLLRTRLSGLGIKAYLSEDLQSPIITTFKFPKRDFDFSHFYAYVKERGYLLYPGKLTDEDTFRIGNIGDIHPSDIEELSGIIKTYMESY